MSVKTELTRDDLVIIEKALECYHNSAYLFETSKEERSEISRILVKIKDLLYEEYIKRV